MGDNFVILGCVIFLLSRVTVRLYRTWQSERENKKVAELHCQGLTTTPHSSDAEYREVVYGEKV